MSVFLKSRKISITIKLLLIKLVVSSFFYINFSFHFLYILKYFTIFYFWSLIFLVSFVCFFGLDF